MSGSESSPRVAVVGAGITGLAAAHRLHELLPGARISILESSSRAGGVLQSTRRDGRLIEHSADMFITKQPWALALCERIGLADDLLPTNNEFRRSFVAWRGKLEPIPDGFTLLAPTSVWPILKSRLLSWPGKIRMGYELFVPRRDSSEDESLADFACRRLGREAFERLVQPLIGGIYTADPEKLSMSATMPNFVELERERGGLIRGMRHSKEPAEKASGARYGAFVAPREGIQQLIDCLVGRLSDADFYFDTSVSRLERVNSSSGWRILCEQETHPLHGQEFDQVVLAVPSSVAARVLQTHDADLAEQLARITRASAAVVVTVYRREQIKHPLNGFGFVVPHIESRPILACSFSSIKFDNRASSDEVIMRTFVGGACHAELLEQTDEEIEQMVQLQLGELLGASGTPRFVQTMRWHDTMPQYHVGHLDLVDSIEQNVATHPGLHLAGNSYRGVGIPFCVRSGEAAAATIAKHHTQQTTAKD